jgi:DNA-binding LytR/AlgR family response regulator
MRIAICDSNKNGRREITQCISSVDIENNPFDIVEFEHEDNILEYYKCNGVFDIVYLSMELYHTPLSGIEIGQRLRKLDENVILFFLSSHQFNVQDMFDIGAFQLILKPIDKNFLISEFKRAVNTIYKRKSTYKITYKGETSIILKNDIIYIETYDRHLRMTTNERKYEYTGKISAEEKKFESYEFIRCHKSYIINMNHITHIIGNDFILSNGDVVPISKQHRSDIIKCYNEFNSK